METTPTSESLETQKGFEAGYKLRLYNQDLLSKIIDSFKAGDPYSDGLFAGIKQAEQELAKQKEEQTQKKEERTNELKQLRDKGKEQEKGRER